MDTLERSLQWELGSGHQDWSDYPHAWLLVGRAPNRVLEGYG
jgi:hypothetical protein